jgi:heme/copper-type cytochrome/quinol oxidase subunit 2
MTLRLKKTNSGASTPPAMAKKRSSKTTFFLIFISFIALCAIVPVFAPLPSIPFPSRHDHHHHAHHSHHKKVPFFTLFSPLFIVLTFWVFSISSLFHNMNSLFVKC